MAPAGVVQRDKVGQVRQGGVGHGHVQDLGRIAQLADDLLVVQALVDAAHLSPAAARRTDQAAAYHVHRKGCQAMRVSFLGCTHTCWITTGVQHSISMQLFLCTIYINTMACSDRTLSSSKTSEQGHTCRPRLRVQGI